MSESHVQQDQLFGRWLLRSYVVAIGSGDYEPVLGAHATGAISFSREGWMMAMIIPEDNHPRGAMPLAYSGTYIVEDNHVVIQVDCASLPAWRGSIQRRSISFLSDRLVLSATQASSSLAPGQTSRARAEWARPNA